MVWFIITLIFSTLVDVIRIGRLSDQEKDLEIMILRHQLDILAPSQKVNCVNWASGYPSPRFVTSSISMASYQPRADADSSTISK